MTSYNEVPYAFNELHEDMSSLCLKNKVFKVKISYLSKEINTLKDNGEKSQID